MSCAEEIKTKNVKKKGNRIKNGTDLEITILSEQKNVTRVNV